MRARPAAAIDPAGNGISHALNGYVTEMVTWLTRSLLFIVAGAVLAYAVTVRTEHIDLQTTGVILLLVGVFDLLLNFGLTMYLRQPLHHEITARRYTADRSYATARPYPADRQYPADQPYRADRPYSADRPYPADRPSMQPPPTRQRPTTADDDERNATRPIRRDYPDWH